MKKRRKARLSCKIYGLADPESGKIRYIGQTKLNPTKRLTFHRKTIRKYVRIGKRLSPIQAWIYDLMQSGLKPQMVIIDNNATWNISEVIWIERYRASGHELLNVLRGGNDSYDAMVRDTGNRVPPLYIPIDALEREFRDTIGK